MKVLVTGGSGFVGRHVVTRLLERGHEPIVLGRDPARIEEMPWRNAVRFVCCDIHGSQTPLLTELGEPDVLVHLAWDGLPNYREPFHYEINLQGDYRFIKRLVSQGLKQVLVSGTCLEYGMREGCLDESLVSDPQLSYPLAKDVLRKFLQQLQQKVPFQLVWARLFYLFGEGQNPNSLLAQLDRAVASGDKRFNMSGGEQLRDYLPVEKAALILSELIERKEDFGIVNVCSGSPVRVRDLIEKRLREQGASMALNLGHYPYPDYEPMAFWGSTAKLESCLLGHKDTHGI
ncbi:dTDP-6-deoxy-L-talose 4-dehydrogenase (NAD+) [Mariprofundus ferrinatatus]|uniref:dTDP-6-deoxy-L-talose 4-dehydrogenase (NAD+) n=1 Tax=Mariprofundus ferrinatatus TaxID=1921087 RepID=A0A2K8L6W6_9PROT|nr:NAD(P)-dependent oxidoreductase [Mariprofundus ferrinatatus]ATX82973.1 dTDP-6-deoxy-L-talose 4-dehydrogenase (NAD+) [Mariprofundus ferrinatatus]